MKQEKKITGNKAGFSSKLGFVLAAVGSAVGLGNIWRFPYLAAKYGGGIFLLVYIVLAVTFGFALCLTEIAIGRRTGKSVLSAYNDVHPKFGGLGLLAASVPVIILPYYCVIGGWVLKYLTVYITGQKAVAPSVEAGKDAYSLFFDGFITSVGPSTVFFVVYLLLTGIIVLMGVEKGIEKVSKLLMPLLVVLTIGISVYALTIDGAFDGVKYYLTPDFSKFSFKTVVAAMGQLFYSMSIAMGILITYGSYMRKEDKLEEAVRYVEIFDTGIAFLAGLMIIPSVFAFSGGDESALGYGPGLMFVTLPKVFDHMVGGEIVGIIFFLLVALAALTSSIALMETIVSMLMEKFHLGRKTACLVTILVSVVLGLLSIFGYSVFPTFTLFGKQMLDFFDFISNNVIMPLVALITCILIGYIVKPKYVEEEVTVNSKFKSKLLYEVMIKFICPVCMVIIFISSLAGYV